MAIDLNPTAPDMTAATNSATSCSLTTTSQTSVQTLANSNCMADSVLNIRADATMAVPFQRIAQESPATLLEYIGIIATTTSLCKFKVQVMVMQRLLAVKLYGYRARADASIYAALVQSEVLSA